MIRKAILSGAAVLAVAVFCFGRDAASYVGTSLGWVKDSVKSAVPIEFEIERARGLVQNLVPDIRANMHRIAKEEVEVERLGKQIAASESQLTKDRQQLEQLAADLSSGKSRFQYAGRSYTSEQVKVDLANRFERYKTGEATLTSLCDMRDARQRSLDGARQKLDGMLAARRQLEVDVAHLEARLQMVEAAQATSEYAFDDSQLSRAKQLVTDLRTRLDVAERLVHAESYLQSEIPLDAVSTENILDEVTSYFGHSAALLGESSPAVGQDQLAGDTSVNKEL